MKASKNSVTLCKLSAFFSVWKHNIWNKLFLRELTSNSNELLIDVYVTNCYFCIFFCHFTLKSTFFFLFFFFLNKEFLMFTRSYTRRFHEASFNKFHSILKEIFFCFLKFMYNIFDFVHIHYNIQWNYRKHWTVEVWSVR